MKCQQRIRKCPAREKETSNIQIRKKSVEKIKILGLMESIRKEWSAYISTAFNVADLV